MGYLEVEVVNYAKRRITCPSRLRLNHAMRSQVLHPLDTRILIFNRYRKGPWEKHRVAILLLKPPQSEFHKPAPRDGRGGRCRVCSEVCTAEGHDASGTERMQAGGESKGQGN